MFYKNKLKTKSTSEKTFEFDMFSSPAQTEKEQSLCDFNLTKLCYNFRTNRGVLESGYGFDIFASPLSKSDLESETAVAISGNQVSALWDFEWYDQENDENKYYCMYFNDQAKVCYDNLFGSRPTTLIINTQFTDTPVGMKYKIEGVDSMIFSGKGQNLLVLVGQTQQTSQSAPQMLSICAHFGRVFAITSEARGRLVYSDNLDILQWSDELSANLDFTDGRGNLTKLLSFNDYIYIFREYGITRISEYSSDSEFSITHLYQSDSYIYPNSIAHGGDRIYFLEKSGLKYFNGSSVRSIECPEIKMLSSFNGNCASQCFEGKYFLACKMDFDGDSVGCENSEQSFYNNALLVYDEQTEHVEIVRGVDIKQMLALNNPYKSKLVACFNGDNKGKIGQLSFSGKSFNDVLPAKWQSVCTDLGISGKKKRIRSFLIKSILPCKVVITSDLQTKEFSVEGSSAIQQIHAGIYGNEFSVVITSNQPNSKISSFVLNVGVEN